MVDKAWKVHERSVAKLFGTERHKQSLKNDHRRTGTSPSDVVVDVDEWYEHIGKKDWPKPFDSIIVECKHTGNLKSDVATWPKRYKKEREKFPASFPLDKMRMILTLRGDWMVMSLNDFPAFYRAVLCSELQGMDWLRQLTRHFMFIHTNREAPNYFQEWEDQTRGWKPEVLGRVLPIICLASPIRMQGPGGGKIVALQISQELQDQLGG